MTLQITSVSRATDSQWDEIWENCPYATYFHSREWAEIWNRYTRGEIRPDPRMLVFSDGNRALVPFSVRVRIAGLIKIHLLSPAGTYGGWISTDPLAAGHGVLLAEYILKQGKNLVWRLNPFQQPQPDIPAASQRDDNTRALDLRDGFDAAFKNESDGHKSASNKAQREGVRVELARDLDDWRRYFEAYQQSILRWGIRPSSAYGFALFEEMFRRESGCIRLWLATWQDRVVAGALCFYASKHVVYWHSAAREEHFKLRPVNFLLREAVRHACETGFEWFDFNPSGGHAGVESFKKHFGAASLACPVVSVDSLPVGLIKKALRLAGLRKQ